MNVIFLENFFFDGKIMMFFFPKKSSFSMVIWCAHYLMISDMSLPFPFHVIEGKNIR